MSTKITVTYKQQDYVLEYNRTAVKRMEANGFSLDKLGDMPGTMVPLLVYGAFMKNHRGLKPELMDEIFDNLANKDGDGENTFIKCLLEMYAETVNSMIDSEPADEGNAATWKVSKA